MSRRQMTKKNKLKNMSVDEAEGEIEWMLEARAEGCTWNQLALQYGVSINTLKKFIGIKPKQN